MGCFVSTNNNKAKSESNLQNQEQETASLFNESRAPPPSADEETIVKEVVLSVSDLTLNSKPILESAQQNQTTQKVPVFDINAANLLCKSNSIKKAENFLLPTALPDDVSEICSVSTIEFDELEQKPRAVTSNHRDPTRSSAESPVRRNGLSNNNQGMGKRVGSKSEFRRRDPGESSGRRSRSPVTNRSVLMGRSPSGRRSCNPARASSRTVEESCGDDMEYCKWSPRKNNNGVNNDTQESLENPLVSLECFIFL